MAKRVASSTTSATTPGRFFRVLLPGALLMVMGAALSIPFVYETQTLWYKVGVDKLTLRSAQMLGLAAVVLLMVQILLGARGRLLQQLYGAAALMRWHRVNGIIIALLAGSHMLLVLLPEGLTNLPIGIKYWPEMLGMLLLGIILVLVISAQWRRQLRLNYQRWRLFHKVFGYLILMLIGLHVLFVSESFQLIVPRTAFLVVFAGVVAAVLMSKKAPGLQQ